MFGRENKNRLQPNSVGPLPNLCLVGCKGLLRTTLIHTIFGWGNKNILQLNSVSPPPNLCLVGCNGLLQPVLIQGLF